MVLTIGLGRLRWTGYVARGWDGRRGKLVLTVTVHGTRRKTLFFPKMVRWIDRKCKGYLREQQIGWQLLKAEMTGESWWRRRGRVTES